MLISSNQQCCFFHNSHNTNVHTCTISVVKLQVHTQYLVLKRNASLRAVRQYVHTYVDACCRCVLHNIMFVCMYLL